MVAYAARVPAHGPRSVLVRAATIPGNDDWARANPRDVVDGQRRQATLALDLPKGAYRVARVNPKTGAVSRSERIVHPGGEARLRSPEYSEDSALRVVASR